MRVGTHLAPIGRVRKDRVALALALASVLICGGALAQSSVLMDACNALSDKKQRLACFNELMSLKAASGAQSEAADKRLRSAFASIAGAVGSGLSYNAYAALVLEPAKELEVFRREHPGTSPVALQLFDQALLAYRDAQTVWLASVQHGHEGGSFGRRLLNAPEAGISDIVYKHQLPLQTQLSNKPLMVDASLSALWRYADQRARLAVDALEGREVAAGVVSDEVERRAQVARQAALAPQGRARAANATDDCDQWGNPRDANGYPCRP